MNENINTDNEICGGCGAHFETEEHATDCPTLNDETEKELKRP